MIIPLNFGCMSIIIMLKNNASIIVSRDPSVADASGTVGWLGPTPILF
jgi:hypothetical protein